MYGCQPSQHKMLFDQRCSNALKVEEVHESAVLENLVEYPLHI